VSSDTRLARLEEKHRALRQRFNATGKDAERAEAMRDKARELAASELAIHLKALNGEQERIARVHGEMQSREKAESDKQLLLAAITTAEAQLAARLTILEKAKNVGEGRSWLPNLAWSAMAAAAGIWLWNQMVHH